MRIAVSGIAWDVAEDGAVADLLLRHGIDAIDVAPGKYFPRPADASEEQIRAVRRAWSDRGIEITGMQALLFGTSGFNVFGDDASRAAMLAYLASVCRVGGLLGATHLVFGSPRQRDRSGLDDAACMEKACSFFRALGQHAADAGVVVCLEPVPRSYGANFMIDSAQTAAVVAAVGHPAIRMQLDTGALRMNDEDLTVVLSAHGPLIGHVHLSEPGLAPLGDSDTDHAALAAVLRRQFPDAVASIEMVATEREPHLQSIARAVQVAVKHYGGKDAA